MADRFAVGIGAGKTWTSSDTSLWSTTSGGASGASVPGSGDVAIFDGSSGGSGAYAVSLNYSPTCDINFAGISAAVPLLIRSSVRGTQRTITAGVVTVGNYVHFQDIAGAGAGSWDISGVQSGDCGNNSGITLATGATQYWYTATTGAKTWSTAGNWYLGSGGTGGAGRVPLPQDTARFDSASIGAASTTVTQDMPRIPATDWTGVTNTPTFTTSTAASFFGSLTLVSGLTLTVSSQLYTYEGRGSSTLTSAGKTWAKSWTVDCAGGTLTLGDAFTLSSANLPVAITSGTFNDGGFSLTINYVSSVGTATRAIQGNSTWTFRSDNAASPWNVGTAASGLTITAGSSWLIKFTMTLGAARTFAGGGHTYRDFENATTGAFALQFTGSNTFNEIRHDSGRTWLNTAGTTQSLSSLVMDGVTLGSITAASHTLAKIGAGLVIVTGATISRSTATPASIFYAPSSTDGGNNSGWSFSDPTITTDATAAYATWIAPAATARTLFNVAATAASATWTAPPATARLSRRRAIAVSVSRASYNIPSSRSSYNIEVS